MKQQILVLTLSLFVLSSASQTYYQGLERMCRIEKNGKMKCFDAPRKWYYLNTLLIDRDSVFLYKVPVRIEKKDTVYSSSDGGFYYHYGTIQQKDSFEVAYLISYNCDYCGMRIRRDSITGFNFPVPRTDSLKIMRASQVLKIGNTTYRPVKQKEDFYFPQKSVFYFDSNSIYRRNPKGQYHLIAQGIKNFLQTKQLQLDNDTLNICVERFDFFDKKKLMETLVADSFHIDTSNIIFSFSTRNELRMRASRDNKVIRYVEVNEIVDRWKTASVELAYRIVVPLSFRKFRDKEYMNSFKYDKQGEKYKLVGKLPENDWALIEQE